MFIEPLTEKNDDKVYEFLARKYEVPVSLVKRYVSFAMRKNLIRVYTNSHSDEEFKLKEGRIAFTDYNFVNQDRRWDGEENFDEDWMFFMYQIFGKRYIDQFFIYRTLMTHGLFQSCDKKERKRKIEGYDKTTVKVVEAIHLKAGLLA